MCEVEFHTADEGANYMPHFATPSGEDEESWFVKEVQRGLEYRYPSGIPDEVQSRADYEVSVILKMGFPGYFLVVSDFIKWAKEQGIRVRSEEHTSELQSRGHLVCRLLLEKKNQGAT